MKISFDLDDTIIPGSKKFETEQQNLIHKIFSIEKIRKGTITLFKELKQKNYSVGIYTTSYRSGYKIKLTFLLYGFNVDFIINQQKHLVEIKKTNIYSSKYPPMFYIKLHVDDSVGVETEGNQHDFKTIIVSETSLSWTENVKKQIESNFLTNKH